jgi:hypothetical protein
MRCRFTERYQDYEHVGDNGTSTNLAIPCALGPIDVLCSPVSTL